jgi:hypothetical protein
MRPYPYRYDAFGLAIGSELECPDLPLHSADAKKQMLAAKVDLGIKIDRLPQVKQTKVKIDDQIFQWRFKDIGSFRSIGGAVIIVDILSGAKLEDVRLALLGPVLNAVLHQRGDLPLHAAAVVSGGEAVAFCGHSGAGKSTLSAALQQMGYPLLCEDVAIARVDNSGKPRLCPGMHHVRLCSDSLVVLDIRQTDEAAKCIRTDKYHLKTQRAFHHLPCPLAAVYLLENRHKDSEATIQRLSATDSMAALLEYTHHADLIYPLGNPRAHFRQCLQVSRSVPVFRFQRPWNIRRLASSLDVLLAHLRQEQASGVPE